LSGGVPRFARQPNKGKELIMSSAKLHVFSEGGLHMALLVAVLAIFAGVLIQDLFFFSAPKARASC